MSRLFLIVVFNCAMVLGAIAHNAKIATYTLRDTGEGWFIEMNFAQAAIDAQMIKIYGENRLTGMAEGEYKKLFLEYMQDHFHLRVDGEKIRFEQGGIRLGSHQTDIKFILPQIKAQPQHMSVYLPMFEDIYNQTNLFRVYRGGRNFTKFFLSADNDFSANMELRDGVFVSIKKQPYNQFAMISGGIVFLLLIGSIIVILKRQLKNSQLRKT